MNHGIITTAHKKINPEVVNQSIHKTNETLFSSLIEIERDGTAWDLKLRDEKSGWVYSLSIFFVSNRRIELRRHSSGEITGWMQHVMQDEIGKAINGMLGNESISGRWKPGTESASTFRTYFEILFGPSDGDRKIIFEQIWNMTVEPHAENLRKLLSK